MRVVTYNSKGFQVEVVESVLPPVVENEKVAYVEYRGVSTTVISRREKDPSGSVVERIVAARVGREVEVYEDIPERLLDRLKAASSRSKVNGVLVS
ncbi:MAG: hypothetical protein QXU26_01365 [Thermofilaceae archaeon]